jgi:uncharacterized protein involved in tolerance to divalent cations
LLELKLIACAEFIPIKSKYWWHDKLESAEEVKLIMESIAENFNEIEAEIAKTHSYETFVLQQINVSNLSKQASGWWDNILNKDKI